MKRINKITIILACALTLFSCQKSLEVYMGLPLQPKNINSEYEPGLNIFGILKTGETLDTVNHYFEVHQLLYVFDTVSNVIVDYANISLKCINNNTEKKYLLNYVEQGRYHNPVINPKPGDKWEYQCIADTFVVTSVTVIPNKPVIEQGSLQITGNSVSFNIRPDSTAFIYDVYYINNNSFVTNRISATNGIAASVFFNNIATNGQSVIYVIAYDLNFEKYNTGSNTFFKPNAYRPKYTTVNGGYGCFCSASITKLVLN